MQTKTFNKLISLINDCERYGNEYDFGNKNSIDLAIDFIYNIPSLTQKYIKISEIQQHILKTKGFYLNYNLGFPLLEHNVYGKFIFFKENSFYINNLKLPYSVENHYIDTILREVIQFKDNLSNLFKIETDQNTIKRIEKILNSILKDRRYNQPENIYKKDNCIVLDWDNVFLTKMLFNYNNTITYEYKPWDSNQLISKTFNDKEICREFWLYCGDL